MIPPNLCRLRWRLAALALAALAGSGGANQLMIADRSEVAYVAAQMGVQVEGNFARFDAQVDLDPGRLQTSSVSFSVDTSSVIFPAPDVQRELAKPEWFDTAHFPKAEFRSKSIRAVGSGRYEIAGTLTIKGHAREVAVPVTLTRSGDTTFATGTLKIKRLDYGVGEGDWRDTSLIEDEVQIRFKVALSGMAPG